MLISSKFPLTVFDVTIDVIALPLTVDTLISHSVQCSCIWDFSLVS